MAALQPFWDGDEQGPYTSQRSGPYSGATYAANPWDTATLADMRTPGLVTVNVARARHLDIQQLPGSSPFIRAITYEPLRFTMSIRIWTPAQWEALQPIIARLLPIQQKTATAAARNQSPKNVFDVSHPNLAAWNVSAALCIKLGPLTGGQEKTLAIEMLERRRGKTAVFTVNESLNVAAPYNAEQLASKQATAANGQTVTYTPTQGPQQAPSQSGRTLTPTR